MKVYVLSVHTRLENNTGYQFFTSKHAAEKARRAALKSSDDDAFANIHGPYEIELTKSGVLAALNLHAGHPDNG